MAPHVLEGAAPTIIAVTDTVQHEAMGKKYEKPNEKISWILGDKFGEVMPHHSSIKALWETKWKEPCSKGLYPFHDGQLEDFEPIFEYLIKHDINDGYSDAYTAAFLPYAASLTEMGDTATHDGYTSTASQFYLRAACLYRIARFPHISSFPTPPPGPKWEAWEKQKEVYLKAASTWATPVREVLIPHRHAVATTSDRTTIPVYVRLPPSSGGETAKSPTILLITGLDGYRPDNTGRLNEFTNRGWAAVVAEIPGTADCPSDPSDPTSPDRLWTSVLDWMAAQGTFDMARIVVWGLSAGGYYAVRAAHTHASRILGAVAQGAGVHYCFSREWIAGADGREYPFLLSPAMALKWGFASVEDYKREAQGKFSLLTTGVLDVQGARLLLVNGREDGVVPMEDSWVCFERGRAKEGRFWTGRAHMGYPEANGVVYEWMEGVLMGK